MELSALALTGARYILKLITTSKTIDHTKEEAIGKSVKWIKEHIFRMKPAIEEKINKADDSQEKENILVQELTALLHDPGFRNNFTEWLRIQHKDPAIKNYFDGDIDEVKGKVTIGDKLNADKHGNSDRYDRKNIATGRIGKIGGDFQVGDTES